MRGPLSLFYIKNAGEKAISSSFHVQTVGNPSTQQVFRKKELQLYIHFGIILLKIVNSGNFCRMGENS